MKKGIQNIGQIVNWLWRLWKSAIEMPETPRTVYSSAAGIELNELKEGTKAALHLPFLREIVASWRSKTDDDLEKSYLSLQNCEDQRQI